MTIKEAAAAWGITERRVNALCKAGRISGAYKEGRQWFIPDSTQKPMDKRGHRSAMEPAVSSARKPLPIGVSDYRDTCKSYYYVDKTLMIKEFLDERPKVSLFTRPRRFGKTLNMDMLRTFFEKTTEDTSVYFRDKKIWSCGESYLAHHRKYPVIFLSFKDVKYTSWEETYQTLQKLIAQEKLVHVTNGQTFQVAVDLRKSSPDFGKWIGTVVSDENRIRFWVPEGFGHGFVTLSDFADIAIGVTKAFDKESERCIRWDDPALEIDWHGIIAPRVSLKDLEGKLLYEAQVFV